MFLFEYPYRRIRVVDEAHVQTDARVQDPDDCIGAVSRLLISKLETDIVPVISENPQWAGSVVDMVDMLIPHLERNRQEQ